MPPNPPRVKNSSDAPRRRRDGTGAGATPSTGTTAPRDTFWRYAVAPPAAVVAAAFFVVRFAQVEVPPELAAAYGHWSVADAFVEYKGRILLALAASMAAGLALRLIFRPRRPFPSPPAVATDGLPAVGPGLSPPEPEAVAKVESRKSKADMPAAEVPLPMPCGTRGAGRFVWWAFGGLAAAAALSALASSWPFVAWWGAPGRREGLWTWLAYFAVFAFARYFFAGRRAFAFFFGWTAAAGALWGGLCLARELGFDPLASTRAAALLTSSAAVNSGRGLPGEPAFFAPEFIMALPRRSPLTAPELLPSSPFAADTLALGAALLLPMALVWLAGRAAERAERTGRRPARIALYIAAPLLVAALAVLALVSERPGAAVGLLAGLLAADWAAGPWRPRLFRRRRFRLTAGVAAALALVLLTATPGGRDYFAACVAAARAWWSTPPPVDADAEDGRPVLLGFELADNTVTLDFPGTSYRLVFHPATAKATIATIAAADEADEADEADADEIDETDAGEADAIDGNAADAVGGDAYGFELLDAAGRAVPLRWTLTNRGRMRVGRPDPDSPAAAAPEIAGLRLRRPVARRTRPARGFHLELPQPRDGRDFAADFDETDDGRCRYVANPLNRTDTARPAASLEPSSFLGAGAWRALDADRRYRWSRTAPLLAEAGWLGYGPDATVRVFPVVDPLSRFRSGLGAGVVAGPRGGYLKTRLELGRLGLLALLAFWGALGWRLASVARRWARARAAAARPDGTVPGDDGDGNDRVYALSVLAALAGLAGYAAAFIWSDGCLQVTPVFWALAGVGLAAAERLAAAVPAGNRF